MSDPLSDFEHDCTKASVSPVDVLVRAGLHRSTWFRWKKGKVSPTLRSLAAAREALQAMDGKRKIAA